MVLSIALFVFGQEFRNIFMKNLLFYIGWNWILKQNLLLKIFQRYDQIKIYLDTWQVQEARAIH